jgi:cell division initiation protein
MRTDNVSDLFGAENVMTPAEVSGKQFRKAVVRGYDVQDVDGYLQRLADTLDMLIGRLRQTTRENDDLKQQVEDYRQMEDSFRSALVASQRLSETIVENARREAEVLVETARVEKIRLQAEAALLPPALKEEIAELREIRNTLRVGLASFLDTQRAVLERVMPAGERTPPPAAPRKKNTHPDSGSVFPPLGIKEDTETETDS